MMHLRCALTAATAAALLFQLSPVALRGQSAASAPVRFGLVTDVHFADIDSNGARTYRESDRKLAECVQVMNDQHVDFLVELGDFKDQAVPSQEASTLSFLRHIESVFAGFRGPRYHVLGNHDVDSLSKSQFLSIANNDKTASPGSYYQFVRNGIRFVALDADHRSDGSDYDHGNFDWGDANVDTAQLDWLERTLLASREPAVVLIHQQLDGEGAYYVRNAAAVRRRLEASGRVLVVFQGHRHEGGFSMINGIPYYTLKGAIEGAGEANNAYAIVSVGPDGVVAVSGFRRAESRSFQAALPLKEKSDLFSGAR